MIIKFQIMQTIKTNAIGLHEIHITVNPTQIFTLRWFCKQHKMKPILASTAYGNHPNQLMISKYKNGSSKEAIEKAYSIAKDMEVAGLEILRVKVEAMVHNKGCPTGDVIPKNPEEYFEFHIKILVDSWDEYQQLSHVATRYSAHLSFNAFKRELEPLVTLRVFNCSYIEAMNKKAELIEAIQGVGFTTNFEIHQEFSVYDSNQKLDKGWLPIYDESK